MTTVYSFSKEFKHSVCQLTVHLPVFYNIYTQLLIQCCTPSHHNSFRSTPAPSSIVLGTHAADVKQWLLGFSHKHRHSGRFSNHYRPLISQLYPFLTIRSMFHVLKCSRDTQMIEVQMWTINPSFTLSYLKVYPSTKRVREHKTTNTGQRVLFLFWSALMS